MDEEFVWEGLGGVVFFDDVVDVGDRRADQESEDESDDKVVGSP